MKKCTILYMCKIVCDRISEKNAFLAFTRECGNACVFARSLVRAHAPQMRDTHRMREERERERAKTLYTQRVRETPTMSTGALCVHPVTFQRIIGV